MGCCPPSSRLLLRLLLLLLCVCPLLCFRTAQGRRFSISGRDFVFEQDGLARPVQIHAGELHYFRVPEVHWEDRLLRLRAMGLNTVSTYVPWNWHESVEGVIDFSSERRNVTKFVGLADSLGLWVILRPGPYICAEWDFGGLPAWLLGHAMRDNFTLRSSDRRYLAFVDRFWGDLLPRVRPLLVEAGGPVALVQLENEYGHWGNASEEGSAYFDYLEEIARRHLGAGVVLVTTDTYINNFNGAGSRPGLLAATNMGPWKKAKPHVKQALGRTGARNGEAPQLVMELWAGWYQSWARSSTERHFRDNATALVSYLKVFLQRNISFCLYMAHGGTNFGFWNSATALTEKEGRDTSFVTTSYDYAAPISEAGNHGFGGDGVDKYAALRKLLASYRAPYEPPLPPEPARPVLADYRGDGPGGEVVLGRRVALRDPAVLAALCDGGWQPEENRPTLMEFHGQQAGLAFYRYRPDGANSTSSSLFAATNDASADGFLSPEKSERQKVLKLRARDRVTVWSGGRLLLQAKLNAALHGKHGQLRKLEVGVPSRGLHNAHHLDVLVEHLGRRAYVKRTRLHVSREAYQDWKGLQQAFLGDKELYGSGWEYCALPLTDLYAFNGSAPEPSETGKLEDPRGPAFFEGSFWVDGDPADTFLQLNRHWQTGSAFVNGFNLGRFLRGARGPFDFYVPKSALRHGRNVVVILEMKPSANSTLEDASVLFAAKRGPMFPSEIE